MILIGVVGGIGSGKSMVSGCLRRNGAAILDADRAGHEALRDSAIEAAVRQRWGADVFARDGHIDRRKLAKIVFDVAPEGPEQLAYLEQITHPWIEHWLRSQLASLAEPGGPPAAVLDAPVMFKAGWDRLCDKILYVDASRNVRLDRVLARGWSEAEFDAREAMQESLDFKRNRSDAVIHNSSSPEDTFTQVEQYWRSLNLVD